MDIKLQFLGGAGNVTGSRHLLEINGARVLVDCGFFQERDLQGRNWEPFVFDPASVDAVAPTHGHLDHCGLLPKLVRDGFKGPIFATSATADIAEIVMRDAAHIQAEDAAFKKRRHEKEGRTSKYGYEPLFTAQDVERVIPLLTKVSFGDTRKVAQGVTLEFSRAGHILGSASVRVTGERHGKTRSVVFSGDIGRPDTPILRDPVPFDSGDIVCMESTYGNRVHKKATSISETLVRVIRAAVKARGNIVIPSFAIERTQELLYRLGNLLRAGEIPSLPVFVDSPMAVRVTEVFRRHPELFDVETQALLESGAHPCDFEGLHLTRSVEESKALNTRPGTSIIIAGSGMCTGGRIKHHLRNNLERPESTILFVGYQAYGTLGRKILEGAREVRLFGEMKSVLARIEKVNGMSAHADQHELVAWLKGQKAPPEQVFMIHGETAAAQSLADRVKRELQIPARVAKYQETVDL